MTSVKNRIHAPGGSLGAASGDHSACRAHLGRRNLKIQQYPLNFMLSGCSSGRTPPENPTSCFWMLSGWSSGRTPRKSGKVESYALKFNTKNLEATRKSNTIDNAISLDATGTSWPTMLPQGPGLTHQTTSSRTLHEQSFIINNRSATWTEIFGCHCIKTPGWPS